MELNQLVSQFEIILQNQKKVNELNYKILRPQPYEEWVETFYELARFQSDAYEQNQAILEGVYSLFRGGGSYNPEEYYIELEKCVRLLHSQNNEDMGLEESFLRILIDYYESIDSQESLIYLYHRLAFVSMQMSRTGDRTLGQTSVEHYRKVVSQKYNEELMSKNGNPVCVAVSYANLLFTEPSLNNMTMTEAYECWKDLCELYASPVYEKYFKTNPKADSFCKFGMSYFRRFAFYLYQESGCNEPEIYPLLVELAKEAYFNSDFVISDDMNPATDDYYLYYILSGELGKLSYEQVWEKLDSYYKKNRNIDFSTADDTVDTVGLLINPVLRLSHIVSKTNFSAGKKHNLILGYCSDTAQIIQNYRHGEHSYSINNVLVDIAKSPYIFSQMETSAEKESFLLRFTVSRQITTFIHSKMVARLAMEIIKYVFDKKPEFLLGVMDYKSEDEINFHKFQILAFTAKAALFHDVGKNSMVDVIMTAYRKLSDTEFRIIKTHPLRGQDFLRLDETLTAYNDIIVGHHKTYDGKGGYPYDFDNTASKLKPIIDLITLCDCIDAASDYLGRNYRRAKSFDTVMQELREGAGEKYHPGYVKLIDDEPQLYKAISDIVGEKRTEVYYGIYQEYISH